MLGVFAAVLLTILALDNPVPAVLLAATLLFAGFWG
jgi:hypothetical protein